MQNAQNEANENGLDNNSLDNLDIIELDVSAIESINDELLKEFYSKERLLPVIRATLHCIDELIDNGLRLPYFSAISHELWQSKPKAVDLYITDISEGRKLNLQARDKGYATNILSYPSEMPTNIIELMPTLPLGELIICHEVIAKEASAQNKSLAQHISHLVVHGILHLLGFDHELGEVEQDEMEALEIAILAQLNLPNPYI